MCPSVRLSTVTSNAWCAACCCCRSWPRCCATTKRCHRCFSPWKLMPAAGLTSPQPWKMPNSKIRFSHHVLVRTERTRMSPDRFILYIYMRSRHGQCPEPCWGTLQCSPRSPSCIWAFLRGGDGRVESRVYHYSKSQRTKQYHTATNEP